MTTKKNNIKTPQLSAKNDKELGGGEKGAALQFIFLNT